MNVRNCRNVKFKGEFVLKNLEILRKNYKFNSNALTLIEVANRDGLKCDTCQASNIHFELHPEYGMTMYSGNVQMTKDHNLLKSLNGSNDASNQHLLCSTCNSLRDSRFAEYKEFKDCYTNALTQGLNPHTVISKMNRNFSYLDSSKNAFVMNTIIPSSTLTNTIKEQLKAHYYKHGRFLDTGFLQLNTVLLFNNEAWNKFINEFVAELLEKRKGCKIEVRSTEFNIFKFKKSSKSITAFLAHMNAFIKKEYHTIKAKNAKELKSKQCIKNVPVAELLKTKPEQTIVVIERKLTWFERMKSYFQVLKIA